MDFVENRNKLGSLYLYQKALESMGASDLENELPTKKELRLKNSIKRVLETLAEFGDLNVSSLMQKSGLHSNTIVRTTPILKEKRIITETRLREQANQKIYSLDFCRAIVFHNNLFAKEILESFHDCFKRAEQAAFKLNDYASPMPSLDLGKQLSDIGKRLSDIVDMEFFVPEDLQKKYGVEISEKRAISEMPAHLANEIIMNYVSGKYCYDCFENGFLSILKRRLDVAYCEKQGKEFYDIIPENQNLFRGLPTSAN